MDGCTCNIYTSADHMRRYNFILLIKGNLRNLFAFTVLSCLRCFFFCVLWNDFRRFNNRRERILDGKKCCGNLENNYYGNLNVFHHFAHPWPLSATEIWKLKILFLSNGKQNKKILLSPPSPPPYSLQKFCLRISAIRLHGNGRLNSVSYIPTLGNKCEKIRSCFGPNV